MTYPHPMDDKTGFEATDEEMGLRPAGLNKWRHKRIYVGPPEAPYAQDQLNAAGRNGWELVQIIGYDAWMKRPAVGDSEK